MVAVLLALAAPFVTAAAPPGAAAAPSDAPYSYRVRSGDTLPKIAAAYLIDPAAAATVRGLNGVGPGRLAAGTTLVLPQALLRTEALSARVTAFRGDVTIGRQGQARVGMVFGEGIRIVTGAGSSVSFRLSDGTAVTLPSLSAIRLVRLRRVLVSGKVQRVLALDRGRSEAKVTPSRDHGVSFEIRTPVSVAAVRGTDFRVSYSQDDRAARAEVLQGAVGVDGTGAGVVLPAGYGARSDAARVGPVTPLLPPPEVQSPVGRRRDGTLVFTVRKMAAAKGYRLLVAADPAFRDLRGEVTTGTEQAVIPALPNGLYYIRATAIDANGLEGRPADYPYDHAVGSDGRALRALPARR